MGGKIEVKIRLNDEALKVVKDKKFAPDEQDAFHAVIGKIANKKDIW